MSPKIRGQSKKLPGHMPGKIDAWLRHWVTLYSCRVVVSLVTVSTGIDKFSLLRSGALVVTNIARPLASLPYSSALEGASSFSVLHSQKA